MRFLRRLPSFFVKKATVCEESKENQKLGFMTDFPKNGAREVRGSSGDSFLVTRLGEEIFVTAAGCPHYSAPLSSEGMLCPGGCDGSAKLSFSGMTEIVCSRHDAAFDLRTGRVLRGPTPSDLEIYTPEINESGELWVSSAKPVKRKPHPSHPKSIAIVGGGAAAAGALGELHAQGFEGNVYVISRESLPPYDRPLLSKAGQLVEEDVVIGGDWGATFLLSTNVSEIEVLENEAVIKMEPPPGSQNPKILTVDKVLVCTGATPKAVSSEGVHVLRSWDDAVSLRASISRMSKNGKLVIIGASFLGVELAATVRKNFPEISVTIIGPDPFSHLFGSAISHAIEQLLIDKGIEIKRDKMISNSKKFIVLKSGNKIPFDVAVVATGVKATVPKIGASEILSDGSLLVDNQMRADTPGVVFAAGDCASVDSGEGVVRFEHWNSAMDMGRIAVRSMLGEKSASFIPFFWSSFFGHTIKTAGNLSHWDELILEGVPNELNFVGFYLKDNRVVAVVGMGPLGNEVMPACISLMNNGQMPGSEILKSTESPGIEILKKFKISGGLHFSKN